MKLEFIEYKIKLIHDVLFSSMRNKKDVLSKDNTPFLYVL